MLLAMGLPRDEALASLRVSFGIINTAAEVDAFLAALAARGRGPAGLPAGHGARASARGTVDARIAA